MRWMIAALLVVFAATSAAADTYCFTGYAYHLDSGKFAYSEHHEQNLVDGTAVTWNVTYRNPDGSVLARKTLDFTDNEFVPVYKLTIPSEGYVEGIAHGENWRLYRRQRRDAKRETEDFQIDPPMAADAGFHPFVQDRFEALMTGKTVAFSFAVAGRQAVVNMQAERIDDTHFEDRPAVTFRAELDMFLISWFVDPLVLVYDPDSKRLLEYRGISNMHNDQGETYPVRVSYYSQPPKDAPDVTTACGGRS